MAKLDLPVLYEDDELLAVNKPADVVVNRAETQAGETVQDWMEARLLQLKQPLSDNKEKSWQELVPDNFTDKYGTVKEIFARRVGMVHRLDKDTSGVLLLAKNPGALVHLLDQFKQRTVEKRYLCLCHGKFNLEQGSVRVPIGRRPDDRQLFGVKVDGKAAETKYKLKQFFAEFNQQLLPAEKRQGQRFSLYQGFSLVEAYPKTGRTHQIRVHFKHLQNPIVGDRSYVGKKRARLDKLWCPRQFLHAAALTFLHPRTGKEKTITADLLPDLKSALQFVS